MTGRKRVEMARAGMAAALMVLFFAHSALAADDPGSWRVTYDRILMYINFLIFAYVLVKYARTPLRNFLGGRREEIETTIQRLEADKRAAEVKIKKMIEAVEKSNVRFAGLKNRIIEQGEKRKAEIVLDAREQGRIIIEDSRRKIDNQILQARQTLKAELVDTAFDLAEKRLPREITLEDDRKIVEYYLNNILPE